MWGPPLPRSPPRSRHPQAASTLLAAVHQLGLIEARSPIVLVHVANRLALVLPYFRPVRRVMPQLGRLWPKLVPLVLN